MIPTKEISNSSQQGMGLRCIFLADAHLRDPAMANYRAMKDFLFRLKGPNSAEMDSLNPDSSGVLVIDHLFILGDYFDFWFSRREKIYPGYVEIVALLKNLQGAGVKIHWCEGNHDFNMKPFFAGILGMNVYEDWAAMAIEGKRVLIGHGDLVDETNGKYLFLRKILRSRMFVFLQKLLPLQVLWRLACRSSQASSEYMGGAKEIIAGKMNSFAEKKHLEGYDVVILGHCHKAYLKETLAAAGCLKTFVTLGDWVSQYTYLHYHDNGFHLCRYGGVGKGIKLDT